MRPDAADAAGGGATRVAKAHAKATGSAEHAAPQTDGLTGIGLAGCGRMGLPMLQALRAAGFDATGFDIRPATDFGPDAALMCFDAARFAAPLRILFSVVRDAAETDALLFGRQAVVDRAPQLETVILCSTLSPAHVDAVRGRLPTRIALIDAPMSGAQVAARERRLSFMLGGAQTALDRLEPLFLAMGRHLHRMGGPGMGMQAKVLNNLLAAASTAATRLALDWADAAGLDERAFLDLVRDSSGQNWLASHFDTIEFARDGYRDDNSIGILVKDVACAMDAAPAGADLTLPRALQAVLAELHPRPPRRG